MGLIVYTMQNTKNERTPKPLRLTTNCRIFGDRINKERVPLFRLCYYTESGDLELIFSR